jgi:DNA polymerase-3 subunit epsilon
MLNQVYAVIDTETTGVGKDDRVCEIAVVFLDQKMNLIDIFCTMINPLVANRAFHINGITDEMLAKAPQPVAVDGYLMRLFAHHRVTTIVGHNVSFDIRMLKQTGFSSIGLSTNQFICTMALEYEACRRNLSLSGLAFRHGLVSMPSQHSAFMDANMCAAVFRKQYHMRIPQMHTPLCSGNFGEAFFMSVVRAGLDMHGALQRLHAGSPDPVRLVAHGISGKRNA